MILGFVFPIKQRFVWRESIFLDDPLTLVALVMRLGTVPDGCLRNNVSAECEMSESGFRVKKTRRSDIREIPPNGINIDRIANFITIPGILLKKPELFRNFVIEEEEGSLRVRDVRLVSFRISANFLLNIQGNSIEYRNLLAHLRRSTHLGNREICYFLGRE